jgi:hypothetical protein
MAEQSAFQMEGFENIMASLDLFIERSMDMRPALTEITQLVTIMEAERFADSGSSFSGGIVEQWQPASDAYLQQKLGPKNKTLVNTGALAHAALFPKVGMTTKTLDIIINTSKAPYGEFHQTGNTSNGVKREWLTITPFFMLEAELILKNYLYSDNPAQMKAENNYAKRAKQAKANSRARMARSKVSHAKKAEQRSANYAERKANATIKREGVAKRRAQRVSDSGRAQDQARFIAQRREQGLTDSQYLNALSNHYAKIHPSHRINLRQSYKVFESMPKVANALRSGKITTKTQLAQIVESHSGVPVTSEHATQMLKFSETYSRDKILNMWGDNPHLY